jgi:hypothetical protein
MPEVGIEIPIVEFYTGLQYSAPDEAQRAR